MRKSMMLALVVAVCMASSVSGYVFSGEYIADKARTYSGAAFADNDIFGVVSLKLGKANKKGVFKITGTLTTLDGKKHAITAGKLTRADDGLTYSGLTVKNYGAMTLRLWANGFQGNIANGWKVETATIDRMPQGTLTFTLNPYPGTLNGRNVIRTEYLPLGMTFTSKGSKFILPKAGTVTYKRGVLAVSKGGEANPSGLKLSYTAKSGTFKGSFNVYVLDGGKLTKYPAKFTGVTVEGYGFAAVTFKKITFTPQVKAFIYQ